MIFRTSSNAGTPFKCHYWLAQCGVYLAVMFLEKLIVGPLIVFDFWNKVKQFATMRKEHCEARPIANHN